MKEDRSIQWQKNFRTRSGATGPFETVAWPSYDQVLNGGHFDSDVPRGVFAGSRTVIGNCGVDANMNFPEKSLETCGTSTTIRETNFSDQKTPLFDGPMLSRSRRAVSTWRAIRIRCNPARADAGNSRPTAAKPTAVRVDRRVPDLSVSYRF
jgi:hypothetical protein